MTEWAELDGARSGRRRRPACAPIESDDRPALPRGWRVLAVSLLLLVVLHFGLIGLLIAAPWSVPTPVQAVAATYLTPWFSQDWRLFAPLPDVHDYAAYARGEYRDGERLVRTPWISLLDPLIASVQANRLSPDGVRLEIAHKATLFAARATGPFGMLPSGRAALTDRWSTLERQPQGVIVVERLASVALADAFPEHTFETVQVMLTARRVAPVDGVSPDDSAIAVVLEPVPFQAVTR